MVLKYHGVRHNTIMETLLSYGCPKLESYHLAQEIISRLDAYASATEAGQRQFNELIRAARKKTKPYWKG